MSKERTISTCGLICSTCLIHIAPNNPEIAQKLAEDFEGKWENVKAKDFRCDGCWAEDHEKWSPDRCCIKDKKLNYCYELQTKSAILSFYY